MIATIEPSGINGTIRAPASKSAMQRTCALALLNQGKTFIQNPGNSNDDIVAMNVIKAFGAALHFENETLIVSSNGNIKPAGTIDCGESGLSFRMFAAIAALSHSTFVLNGEGSLLKRPMHFIDEVFPLLNVKTVSNNGFLPLSVTGPLLPKDITVDGSLSSQYLTGLLFAYARATANPVAIKVNDLKSKPYIDLSIKLLRHFGYCVHHEDYKVFFIDPVGKETRTITCCIEADWSSASFFLVAGAIAGSVNLTGLDMDSPQADKAIIEVLHSCNADIIAGNNSVSVSNKNSLKAFDFNATDCPDLIPPLTVLAAFCEGISVIKGASRLFAKESNRAITLADAFTRMDVEIHLEDDELHVKGSRDIKAAVLSSYNDHRIAMACAIAGLRSTGSMVIHDAAAVNKSYPAFFDHLKLLGASVSLKA